VVSNCTGLSVYYNAAEQDFLNPKGLNAIRKFPCAGIRVWGARTASSKPLWKYINVRRLFIYIEESIKANTNWVVFEPNDARLWARVRGTIESFLTGIWVTGALVGGSPDEAFFVDIGPNTMTKDDIDNGRLICLIGVAPVKPAEFVIFRITQKTGE
jgi:phage tail sheath protein FI